MKKSHHSRSGAKKRGPKKHFALQESFPLIAFTPEELSLFDDAINLLRVIVSAKSEVMPTVNMIGEAATETQQKVADMQKHMGEMFIFQNNDYVVLNTALLVFIQVIQLMPQLLSDELDKPRTEARLLALGKKLAPLLQECCSQSGMERACTLHN